MYCLWNHGETGICSADRLIYLTFLGKDIKMVVPWNLYLRNIMKEEKALFYRYTLCNGGDKLGRNVQQYGGSLMKINVIKSM